MKTASTLILRTLFVACVLFMLPTFSSFGQITVSTQPALGGGNGSGGVAFNLQVTQPILLTDLGVIFTGGANTAYEFWINMNSPVAGPPTVNTANGWTMFQSGTAAAAGPNIPTNVPLNTPMMLSPGTYGMHVNANVTYTTWNTSLPATFTNGAVSIITGTNVGYGGSAPNPTFHPRGFTGYVTYIPASMAPNDASLSNVLVENYCAGDSVEIYGVLSNYGINQIDTCTVNWMIDGVSQPAVVNYTLLDTFGGTNPTSDTILLGTTVLSSAASIVVYSSMPNNVVDTVNGNDTSMLNIYPSLSGVYTVGNATADFMSLSNAVEALDSLSMCGDVTFDILDGTYTDQVQIGDVTGIHTLTIKSQSNDASLVEINFNNPFANNYVIGLDGAKNVKIHDLTLVSTATFYMTSVFLENGASNVEVKNCKLGGTSTTSTSNARSLIRVTGATTNDLKIENCEFEGGSYGVYAVPSTLNNFSLINSTFRNQYFKGVQLNNANGCSISNNHFTSTSTYTGTSRAIDLNSPVYPIIRNNFIDSKASRRWPRQGIYMNAAVGDVNQAGVIAGNRILLGEDALTYEYNGIRSQNGFFMNVYNNSVSIQGSNGNAAGLYLQGGAMNTVVNNISENQGQGYAYRATGAALFKSNNNCISTAGTNLVNRDGTDYTSLSGWQIASGMDSLSVDTFDVYADSLSLKVCNELLDGKGISIGTRTMDFENDPVHTSMPDIGADEFMAAINFTAGPDQVICQGDTIRLEVFYYDSIVWNGITTGNYYNVTTPTQVFVAAYGLCADTVVMDTVVTTLPTNPTLPLNSKVCEGTPLTLDCGIDNASYSWNTGDSTKTITVDTSGFYNVTIVDANGCQFTETNTTSLVLNVDLPDTLIRFCEGVSVNLDAGVPGTYNWSNGPTSSSISVQNSGVYTVTVTNGSCVSQDQAEVEKIPLPLAEFDYSQSFVTVLVNNTSVGGTEFIWDWGDGDSSFVENPVAKVYAQEDSTYTITLIVRNECGENVYKTNVSVGTVGIEDIANQASGVAIYPNPSDGIFNVHFEKEYRNVEVSVHNLQGQVVSTSRIDYISAGQNKRMNVEFLDAGTYFIQLNSEQNHVVIPLVKQ